MERLAFRDGGAVQKWGNFGVVNLPVDTGMAAARFNFRRSHTAAVDADAVLQSGAGVDVGEGVEVVVVGVFAQVLLEKADAIESE